MNTLLDFSVNRKLDSQRLKIPLNYLLKDYEGNRFVDLENTGLSTTLGILQILQVGLSTF